MDKNLKYFGLGILSSFTIIIMLFLIITLIPFGAGLTGSTVAVIPVKGEIAYGSENGSYTIANPDTFDNLMNEAIADPSIKSIVLEINSPGGSLVAAEQIVDSIKKSDKPVVAWISDSGTSAAYYVASGTDEIVASPSSFVGSIGVILTLADLSEYYDKLGVDIYSITGGKYKDMGSDYRSLTTEEKNMLQKMIDEEYNYFISLIAKNRNLSESYVKGIADGKIYTGRQALKLKLVDKIGGKDYAIKLAANMSGLGENYEVVQLNGNPGFLDSASSYFSNLSYNGKRSF